MVQQVFKLTFARVLAMAYCACAILGLCTLFSSLFLLKTLDSDARFALALVGVAILLISFIAYRSTTIRKKIELPCRERVLLQSAAEDRQRQRRRRQQRALQEARTNTLRFMERLYTSSQNPSDDTRLDQLEAASSNPDLETLSPPVEEDEFYPPPYSVTCVHKERERRERERAERINAERQRLIIGRPIQCMRPPPLYTAKGEQPRITSGSPPPQYRAATTIVQSLPRSLSLTDIRIVECRKSKSKSKQRALKTLKKENPSIS